MGVLVLLTNNNNKNNNKNNSNNTNNNKNLLSSFDIVLDCSYPKIANPDLAERVAKGLPLSPTAPGNTWYNCVDGRPSNCYCFPFARA